MTNLKFTNTTLIYLPAKKAEFKTSQKDQSKNQKTAETKINSLEEVKDTVFFIGSSEGENVKLFVNTKTNDSILESEVMGETGMARYKFIFNKELKTGECITLRYAEPIHITHC